MGESILKRPLKVALWSSYYVAFHQKFCITKKKRKNHLILLFESFPFVKSTFLHWLSNQIFETIENYHIEYREVDCINHIIQKQCENCKGLHVCSGAALTVRPVRLEPHQYFWFAIRGQFSKSPKYAIKMIPKKMYPPGASPIFETLRRHW